MNFHAMVNSGSVDVVQVVQMCADVNPAIRRPLRKIKLPEGQYILAFMAGFN